MYVVMPPAAAAPVEAPAILKDAKLDPFVKANLAAAYAKALANKRVYEESLDAVAGFDDDVPLLEELSLARVDCIAGSRAIPRARASFGAA